MQLVKTKKKLEEGVPGFNWDVLEEPKQAIKRHSKASVNFDSISEAFQLEYSETPNMSNTTSDRITDRVVSPGKYMYFTVEDISASGLKLSSDDIKEVIINKDNLRDFPGFKSFLLQTGNKVIGIIKKIVDECVYVDVLEAYYKLWLKDLTDNYIKKETPVNVTDLEMTRGGFLGKINIWTLSDLTGTSWINTCFIPGSQIVLNIEHDFEKWVGQSVTVIPQKFTEFTTLYQHKDNCLVCSRKQLLTYQGNKAMEDMYQCKQLVEKSNNEYVSPTFDGIITGVIKTANKCGVFVELKKEHITGLLPCDTYELSQYHTGDNISVKIRDFEITDKKPFAKNKNGNIQWPNVRVIFKV